MCYSAIILAGGKGNRMNNPIPKQYMLLGGKPVIMHSIERMEVIKEIEEIIIVCSEQYVEYINFMLQQYNINKKIDFAFAGDTRQASVKSGLLKVKNENVIIHEAARPFVSVEDFLELINFENPNTIIGSSINYTVLKGKETIDGLLDRSELINVQLPQKFNTKALLDAHIKAEKENRLFTEDAGLLYFYNSDLKVGIIKGSESNIKLTTPTDMMIGEIIYDKMLKEGL